MRGHNEAELGGGAATSEAVTIRRLPSFRVGTHRVAAATRRRKTKPVRLGGGNQEAARRQSWWRGGGSKRRLRWLGLRCFLAMRALRKIYANFLRDLAMVSASPGAAEARLAMESFFFMPAALPISLAAFTSPRLL